MATEPRVPINELVALKARLALVPRPGLVVDACGGEPSPDQRVMKPPVGPESIKVTLTTTPVTSAGTAVPAKVCPPTWNRVVLPAASGPGSIGAPPGLKPSFK